MLYTKELATAPQGLHTKCSPLQFVFGQISFWPCFFPVFLFLMRSFIASRPLAGAMFVTASVESFCQPETRYAFETIQKPVREPSRKAICKAICKAGCEIGGEIGCQSSCKGGDENHQKTGSQARYKGCNKACKG